MTGDVIVAIDGHEVAPAGLADSIGRMRGEPGTRVRVTIERDGIDEPVEYVIERAQVDVESVRQALLEPGYGYLRISHFSETTLPDLEQALAAVRRASGRPVQGLVLDLRGNPGGVLEAGVEVADAFLEQGVIITASGRSRDARFRMEATPGDISRGARLAVLVNGGSASASEIVAGALQDHGRAALIGRTTFGKGSVQTVLPLSEGRAIKLTTSRYYTPAGTSIHEKGIEPELVLPREDTAADRTARASVPPPERDAEVLAALEWLKAGQTPRMAVEHPRRSQ